MECFNCFQRGFCGYGVKSISEKVLRFCSKACAEAYREVQDREFREHAIQSCEEDLIDANDSLKISKSKTPDLYSIPEQKLIFTRILLNKALLAEKPKKELNRLFDLFKDQLSDMLTLIGDNSSENTMLIWAEEIKQTHEIIPILIQLLGK